jgi:hypothetical protein
MRKQLNELMDLAKQVREVINENKLYDVTLKTHQVSTWITAYCIDHNYHYVSFLSNGTKKLDVHLFTIDQRTVNNITVDVENLSDEDLDSIILRSKQDIDIFIADLAANIETARIKRIQNLEDQLLALKKDVPNS